MSLPSSFAAARFNSSCDVQTSQSFASSVYSRGEQSSLSTQSQPLSTGQISRPASAFPFLKLPVEIRDQIYVYISLTEDTWIGSPPLPDHGKNVIVEQTRPSTYVKTSHSIIILSREVRAEFRCAVWHNYMTTLRQIDIRVHDFVTRPLAFFFALCSPLEREKLNTPAKCRVRLHLTTNFQKYRLSRVADRKIAEALDAYVAFCERVHLVVEHSLDRFEWYDLRLLRSALRSEGRMVGHIDGWEERWERELYCALLVIVDEAYEISSVTRESQRSAFHSLGPLGR